MTDEDLCTVCTKTEDWHIENRDKVRHHFTPPGQDPTAALSQAGMGKRPGERRPPNVQRSASVSSPLDPVLRILLVRKGVITADELETMEKELRATGVLRA